MEYVILLLFEFLNKKVWALLDPHRFKEHKRCSYMIANALDADNKFTAVQVSHKLKQLGLRVPQQKKFEANMLIKNENSNSLFTDNADDPDDETLLSLLNR